MKYQLLMFHLMFFWYAYGFVLGKSEANMSSSTFIVYTATAGALMMVIAIILRYKR